MPDVAPDPRILLERIGGILSRYAFRYANEVQLHEAIAQVLARESIPFERERIDGANRYDFFCAGVVVEVKMARSATEAWRQIDRYCASDQVAAVIVVSTKSWAKGGGGALGKIREKPVVVVRIRGQAF